MHRYAMERSGEFLRPRKEKCIMARAKKKRNRT
jgi:hypothetical protein